MSVQVSRLTADGVQAGPTFTDPITADWFASISAAVAHGAGREETFAVSEVEGGTS